MSVMPAASPTVMRPSESARHLVLVVRNAPSLPTVLYRDALAMAHGEGMDADSMLKALLTRLELPLSDLVPDPDTLAGRHPSVLGSYLSRPEHTDEELAVLFAGGVSAKVAQWVIGPRTHQARAVAALLEACTDYDVLATVAKRASLPAVLRAQALSRMWDMHRHCPQERDVQELQDLVKMLRRNALGARSAADELVHVTTSPALLVLCARWVTTATAADRIITVGVADAAQDPAGIAQVDLLDEGGMRGALNLAATRLPSYASAEACSALADWWEGPGGDWAQTLQAEGLFRPLELDRQQLVTYLRGHGRLESQPWSVASRPTSPDDSVELTSYLVERFGENDLAWAAYPQIAATFTGSVGQLADAVLAASSQASTT